MRDLRKGRGWSAQRLAEEMTRVGISWDRSIVANLESGRRRAVSVEEWLALSFVLDVAPVHLLVPPTDDQRPATGGFVEVQPVGTVTTTPGFMRAWVRGQTPISTVDARRYFSEVPESEWQVPAGQWTPENIERQSDAVRGAKERRDGDR
ncbi:helix-turn-helix transcriptional regulator [Micromonospora sp. A200]|uniref:helix-turn-helix transcriptional regulator n=1 Tax=Micromonospora sp. A200 TaxID=2940568 RepID=UPI0024768AC7|nr:helix-turn-helix transcriptional regulator [Micromonospora sp. A200]